MVEYHLDTPVSEEEARSLRIRDIVYITGKIFTARDAAHVRALEYHRQGKKLPIDMRGSVLYHCGPVVRKVRGGWDIVSAGPTTSARMEIFEDEFIEKFGVRLIIGKGGMGRKTTAAMKRYGAVYCAFTGGAGALAARSLKSVTSVEWFDLGIPEALWVMEAEDFGPLTVAIDVEGNNLYENVMRNVRQNKDKIYQKI
jgi:fumarate hydratase subunit beta